VAVTSTVEADALRAADVVVASLTEVTFKDLETLVKGP
jgi:hypothetical protein